MPSQDIVGDVGNFTPISEEEDIKNYIYTALETPEQKLIFEHTLGYGGKPILSTKDIANKIHKNPSYVLKKRKQMGKIMHDYVGDI